MSYEPEGEGPQPPPAYRPVDPDEAKSVELALRLSMADAPPPFEQKASASASRQVHPNPNAPSAPPRSPDALGYSPRSVSVSQGHEPFGAARVSHDEQEAALANRQGLSVNAAGEVLPAMSVARIHEELLRLAQDERALLSSKDVNEYEKAQIRDQFFHQKMSLLMRLPPEDQAQYHPKSKKPRGSRSRLRSRSNLQQGQDGEVKYRPYFCITMLIVCCVMFIASIGVNGWSFQSFSSNPLIGPGSSALDTLGAKNAYKIRNFNQAYRFITPMFLHGGIIHLVMNMMVLMRMGWSMEEAFGPVRIAVVYLVSGIFSMMVSALFLPGALSVGASGALFGLIGALLGDFFQNHQLMAEGKWGYLAQLIVSIVVGLCIGLLPLLDNFCHVGGLIAGLLLGTAFLGGTMYDEFGQLHWAKYGKAAMVLSLVAFSGLTLAGFIAFYQGSNGTAWCKWCSYISCLDTNWWSCDTNRLLESCTADPSVAQPTTCNS